MQAYIFWRARLRVWSSERHLGFKLGRGLERDKNASQGVGVRHLLCSSQYGGELTTASSKTKTPALQANLSHEMLLLLSLLLLLLLFFFSGERELSLWPWYNFANTITNGKLITLTDILLKSSWEELISFNLIFSLCTFSQNKKEN